MYLIIAAAIILIALFFYIIGYFIKKYGLRHKEFSHAEEEPVFTELTMDAPKKSKNKVLGHPKIKRLVKKK